MRHRVQRHRLGRVSAQRKALLRNLLTSLILHEKITTTEIRSKALVALFDRLVTIVKRKDDVGAIRYIKSLVFGETASRKVFDDIRNRLKNRSSGYVSMKKTAFRKGDNAPLVHLNILFDSRV